MSEKTNIGSILSAFFLLILVGSMLFSVIDFEALTEKWNNRKILIGIFAAMILIIWALVWYLNYQYKKEQTKSTNKQNELQEEQAYRDAEIIKIHNKYLTEIKSINKEFIESGKNYNEHEKNINDNRSEISKNKSEISKNKSDIEEIKNDIEELKKSKQPVRKRNNTKNGK